VSVKGVEVRILSAAYRQGWARCVVPGAWRRTDRAFHRVEAIRAWTKPVGGTKPVGATKPVGRTKPVGATKPVGRTKLVGANSGSGDARSQAAVFLGDVHGRGAVARVELADHRREVIADSPSCRQVQGTGQLRSAHRPVRAGSGCQLVGRASLSRKPEAPPAIAWRRYRTSRTWERDERASHRREDHALRAAKANRPKSQVGRWPPAPAEGGRALRHGRCPGGTPTRRRSLPPASRRPSRTSPRRSSRVRRPRCGSRGSASRTE
jgi:hypothetical protein